jgi:thiol:disulfide interchange protein DsbA
LTTAGRRKEPSAAATVTALTSRRRGPRAAEQNHKESDMHQTRRRLVLATALLPALPAANGQPKAAAGKDYREVSPPQPVDAGNKVEVLEFFQYSCPHCYSFTPRVEAWRKKRAADIDYKRVPINWDNSTLNHTKIYFTLEQMNLLDKMHEKVFAAIQRERKRLLDPKEIADFMAANGIDRAQWESNFNSFAVATRTSRAGQVWRAYKIDSTPAAAVDGRFVTGPGMAGSLDGMVLVMDELVTRAQRERPKK